jgi:predicted cobalt transporter CbtA
MPSPSLAIEAPTKGLSRGITMQFELAARLGGASFGVAALLGLLATGLQHWQVLPLLFDAEAFERRLSEHEHEMEPWAPEDGAERTSYTILSNIAITWGFALALHAGMLLYNCPVTSWQGVGLGVGGWVTVILLALTLDLSLLTALLPHPPTPPSLSLPLTSPLTLTLTLAR